MADLFDLELHETNSVEEGDSEDDAIEVDTEVSEVADACQKFLNMCETRQEKLADTGDLFRFVRMVRDLMLWMEDTVRLMNTSEKPRDVSGVELLMNNHQSLKAEIDTREENISTCINLGKELLSRNHYASNEIKEKLLSLTNQRTIMMDRWEERWEHLQNILEVYQFAGDAAVAEASLIATQPYLLSQELGHTLDEVEKLIERQEALENSAATQEERLAALGRLTTAHVGGGGQMQDHQFSELGFEDALSYTAQVKDTFRSQPQVFRDFCNILNEYKSESINELGAIRRVSNLFNELGAIRRVSNLFRGHPELIVGFNTFLPPGLRIEVQPNEQVHVGGGGQMQDHQFSELEFEDAISYVIQIKDTFRSQPQVFKDFLDIMNEYTSESINELGAIQRVSNLFRGHPELIHGFLAFLPLDYRIEVQPNEQVHVSIPGSNLGGG